MSSLADRPLSEILADAEARRAAEITRRRELVADLRILDTYDAIRSSLGHDYGSGQRHAELARLRWSLPADVDPPSVEELVDAYERVGAPRLRRIVERETYRRSTPSSSRTIRAWERVARMYARSSS